MNNPKHSKVALLIENSSRGKHLTQQEIADIIGISRRSYNNIKNGEKSLSLQEASVICGEFGIQLDELCSAEMGVIIK